MNHINSTALLLGLTCFFFSAASADRVTFAHGVMCRCEHCRAANSTDNDTFAQEPHGFFTSGDVHDEPGAFVTTGNGWSSTSSGGSSLGAPATLTWSIVPNGTGLPGNFIKNTGSSGGVNTPSDLITFLDGIHHNGASPGGGDLTQRDWWGLINSSYERWDAVSGLAFSYESQDDGRPIVASNSNRGVLGTRGDLRIGGHSIDGQISPTILAFNYFPNIGDMVIDTDEINRWGNPTNNFRTFRNMLMHEIGHGIGLNHVQPVNQTKLMEPFISVAYDGPQLDDILGAHRLYGDKNEEGNGNDTHLNATSIGTVDFGQMISIGTDAVDTLVTPDEVDFVSIDDNSDIDYFQFSINYPGLVDLTLTPLGPTYSEGSGSFDSSAQSNLTLTLYDINGTSLLEDSNVTGIGLSEKISQYRLPGAGDYFVRVGGFNNAAQFYQLDIAAVPEPSTWCLGGLGLAILSSMRRRRRIAASGR